MNIYDILKKDHETVRGLLDQLASAEEAKSRTPLINKISEELVPHSRSEEWVLYNLLRDLDQSKDVVMHSFQEHVKAETLLRALQVSETVHIKWQSGVEKLREELNHHIEEEEGKVFSAAKKVLSEQEAQLLGKAFQEAKSKVGSNFLSSQFELLMNLMPQRFRQSFMKHMNEQSQKKAS